MFDVSVVLVEVVVVVVVGGEGKREGEKLVRVVVLLFVVQRVGVLAINLSNNIAKEAPAIDTSTVLSYMISVLGV